MVIYEATDDKFKKSNLTLRVGTNSKTQNYEPQKLAVISLILTQLKTCTLESRLMKL